MENTDSLAAKDGTYSPVSPVSPLPPFSPFMSADPAELCAWDQIAQRDYVSAVLVFPFDGDKAAAEAHISASLTRLQHQYKHFAASLKIDPHTGRVRVEKHTNDEIPFKVVDHGAKLPYTYDQLKAKEFAPSAFVDPDFTVDGALNPFCLVPVSQVRLSFIDGGLILWIYLHHTITDGSGLRRFLECLAAQTRGDKYDHPMKIKFDPPTTTTTTTTGNNESPTASGSSYTAADTPNSFEELVAECPEYTTVPAFTKPRPIPDGYVEVLGTPGCQINYHSMNEQIRGPRRKGSMFVFRNERLDQLRDLIEAIYPAAALGRPGAPSAKKWRPSTHVALAALTWVHATKARLATETFADAHTKAEISNSGGGGGDEIPHEQNDHPATAAVSTAKLLTCVDWKLRAFTAEGSTDWFGVGIAFPATIAPVAAVTAACDDFHAIIPLLGDIEAAIASVDEGFVAKRTATIQAAMAPAAAAAKEEEEENGGGSGSGGGGGGGGDPRAMALDLDGNNPGHLMFNTWRFIGMDTVWEIPGIKTPSPAALRAARGGTPLGYAQILPAKKGSEVVELALYIPEKAMEALMKDADYMRWVDHVVE